MFKFIAILLIFTSSTIIGFYQSGQLTRRRKLLVEYRDLLQRLEAEMGYFKEPLPMILKKLQTGSNEPADLLLRQCLLQMETTKEPMDDIWKHAVKSAYENEPVKPSDLDVFMKCGAFIGQSDYQRQKGHFELLRKDLSDRIEDAAAVCSIKGPLYSKAGISVGAVLAIALL